MNETMATATQTLSEDVLEQLDATLEHFNANHADTVLLLARYAADRVDAVTADAVAVDAEGIDLALTLSGDDAATARLRFDAPVSTQAEVQMAVMAKIAEARTTAGDAMAETSMEHELRVNPTLPTFLTSVVGVTDLSPNLREIHLRGGLESFETLGGDQFVFVIVPSASMDGTFPEGYTMADFLALEPDERPQVPITPCATTTPPRRRSPCGQSFTTTTAASADGSRRPKSVTSSRCGGPRTGFTRSSDTIESYLFVVDESAFAAVASLIEEIDGEAPVHVIAETADAAHEIALPQRPGVTVEWLHRGDAAPGDPTLLFDAVRNREIDPTSTFAFGGGESRVMTAARKHLRHELGMRPTQVSFTGYWRR